MINYIIAETGKILSFISMLHIMSYVQNITKKIHNLKTNTDLDWTFLIISQAWISPAVLLVPFSRKGWTHIWLDGLCVYGGIGLGISSSVWLSNEILV